MRGDYRLLRLGGFAFLSLITVLSPGFCGHGEPRHFRTHSPEKYVEVQRVRAPALPATQTAGGRTGCLSRGCHDTEWVERLALRYEPDDDIVHP